jgi:hypothetical protein
MSEKSVNILEIITGALMIAAPLFGWWVNIEIGDMISIAFWEWGIYDEIAIWQSIFLVACTIILITGGVFYILNAIKRLKPLPLIRFILLCAGFTGMLASTIGIMVDNELPVFHFTEKAVTGLGPGLYLGIAALVFGVILFLKDFKTNT